MDYIFDWARDVYRATIICELRNLAANDTVSLAMDSDIFSLQDHTNFGIHFGQTHVISEDEEDHPTKQTMLSMTNAQDDLRTFDSSYGVLRDARYIRSRFMALHITEDNLSFLLNSMETPDEAQEVARRIVQCLKDSWRVSSQALDVIENIWTDEDRTNWESPKREFHVTVTLSAYLSLDWEQTRELCCLAVSEGAVKELLQFAKLKDNQPCVPPDNPWITTDVFVGVFTEYLTMGVKQNLLAAVSRASVSTKLITDLTKPMANNSQAPEMLPDSYTVARELVCSIYNLHKIGRNEPSSSILRISSKLVLQEQLADSSMKSIWPGPDLSAILSKRAQNAIFVTSNSPSNGPQILELCIFVMDVSQIQGLTEKLTPIQPHTPCRFQTTRVSSKSGWVGGWNKTDMQMHDADFLDNKNKFLTYLKRSRFFSRHGVLSMQGKHEEVETMHRRHIEGSEKVVGQEHPDTLRVSNVSNVPSMFFMNDSNNERSDSTTRSRYAGDKYASEQLAAELFKVDELRVLYEAALPKLGTEIFSQIHDILLKNFLIKLRAGASGHELQALWVLRGKLSRNRATQRIMELLEPSSSQVMRGFQNIEPDRQYALNQHLKTSLQIPETPGGITEAVVTRFDAGRSIESGYSEEGSDEDSKDVSEENPDENSNENFDAELEKPSEPLDGGVTFLIKGRPFTQFVTGLRSFIHPPTTLQEALDIGDRSAIQRLLKNHFQAVAIDSYAWLDELREAGYSWREMAELLSEEANYAPWIPFNSRPSEYVNIQLGSHTPRCVHQITIKDFELPSSNFNLSAAALYRRTEESKRAVEELCGLAGVSPTSWDREDWNGSVSFDKNNTHANVSYNHDDHEDSDMKVKISRITKALGGFCQAFGYIQQAGLCCDGFTVIVNVAPKSATSTSSPGQVLSQSPQLELFRVNLSLVLQLQQELKYLSSLEALTQAKGTNCRKIAETILEPILCNTIHQKITPAEISDSTLHLSALAVQFLCLGLVSYSQAHVGAIHPFFLDTPQFCVNLCGTTAKDSKITARLEYLTCMGKMLKDQPVMTFTGVMQQGLALHEDDSKYDLLASPEDILDTWGPGHFVYRKDNEEQPCAINVGGGIIYARDDNAKTFHWDLKETINNEEWQTDHYKEESSKKLYTVPFPSNLKIVIGTPVTINEVCSLDEEKRWKDWNHVLDNLSSYESYWRQDERQILLSAGQYISVQVALGWHKVEGRTLKQVVLDNDDRYLIECLEENWGLQVSLCTGIAKRVPLRQLVAELVPLFASIAIARNSIEGNIWQCMITENIVYKFQNSKVTDWYPHLESDHKEVVQKLVGFILRSLKDTGLDHAGNMVICWPKNNLVQQCFKLPRRKGHLAGIFADSKDSATFAYVSTKCLVSSPVLCAGGTSDWRNMSNMLGTAVLPPKSVSNPSDWVLDKNVKYCMKTRDSIIPVRLYSSGTESLLGHATLVTRSTKIPPNFRQRLMNYHKEDGILRERQNDRQHSMEVLVINQKGVLASEGFTSDGRGNTKRQKRCID